MKIHSGSFMNSIKNLTKIMKPKIDNKKIDNRDNNDGAVINISKKINQIKRNQNKIQSSISEKQYVKSEIKELIDEINRSETKTNMKEIKTHLAKYISNAEYGNNNLLNEYLTNIEIQAKSAGELRDVFNSMINKLNDEIKELINSVNKLSISESNLLSINFSDEKTILKYTEELKRNRNIAEGLHSTIDPSNIEELLE